MWTKVAMMHIETPEQYGVNALKVVIMPCSDKRAACILHFLARLFVVRAPQLLGAIPVSGTADRNSATAIFASDCGCLGG
jgi:hypothetical protein